jgi:excisionase family DNA binding protein
MQFQHYQTVPLECKNGFMNADVPTLPELMTVDQLAEYLGVPRRSVYFWRERGNGPSGFRVGKRLYFRADDVAAWLDERAGSSTVTKTAPASLDDPEEVKTARRGA